MRTILVVLTFLCMGCSGRVVTYEEAAVSPIQTSDSQIRVVYYGHKYLYRLAIESFQGNERTYPAIAILEIFDPKDEQRFSCYVKDDGAIEIIKNDIECEVMRNGKKYELKIPGCKGFKFHTSIEEGLVYLGW